MKKMFILGLMTVAASSLSADYYRGGYNQPSYYSSGSYYQPSYDGYYNQGGYYSGSYYQPNYYQDGRYYQPQQQNLYIPEQGCQSSNQYHGGYNAYVQDMNHPMYRNEEDRQLQKRIVDALGNRYNSVQVFVDNGNVTIQGYVRNQDEKRDLEDKLRNMSGVRNLNSQVMVQGGERSGLMRPTDRSRGDNYYGNDANRNDYRGDNGQDRDRSNDGDLQRKLRDELSNYDNVSAQVNNGEVTLRGSVESQNDKDKVEKRVRSVRGVRNVNNQITVRGSNGSNGSRGY